jgi:3-deoxy-D-manno-octulosonate 8-phosphate phosphatase (KDO 8-P phosphatase)
MLNQAFIEKARNIKLVIFDIDGVFTNGKIYIDDEGIETKAFHVLDGLGIKLLQQAGIEIAIISGRDAKGVEIRMAQLGVQHIFQGCVNKIPVYEKLLQITGFSVQETAYMGDDLPDIPLLKRVGLAVTVPHAVKEVLDCVPFVTKAKGGKGAVREMAEALLCAQGKWEGILKQYA